MRLRVIAILALLLAALIFLSAAQTPDYSGKAKVVIKLTQMPAMPAMPRAEMANTFGMTAGALSMPAVPQGTMVQGEVLYSSDPAIKMNQTYSLYIKYDPQNEPIGFQSGLVDQLKPGAVVGVNDYTLNGNRITVNVGNSMNWRSKVFIVDMQYTNPGETKNPFLINLSAFRQFNPMPTYNYSTQFKPMFNMSVPGWNTPPALNASTSGLSPIDFSGFFSHLFG